jgi:mono/diheme cytochrome c family protein
MYPFNPRLILKSALRSVCGCLALALCFAAPQAWAADSAQSQVSAWIVSAKATDPAYSPSAERGRTLYMRQFGINAEFTNCAACHTANPAAVGKHAVTGKAISPLAPSAHAERFTDAAKTEKWFKRNCHDVIARACTPAEKADFVSYLLGVK